MAKLTRGQTLAEYAIILGCIFLAVGAAAALLGESLSNLLIQFVQFVDQFAESLEAATEVMAAVATTMSPTPTVVVP